MNNKYLLNLIDITVSFEGFLALNKLNLDTNLRASDLSPEDFLLIAEELN